MKNEVYAVAALEKWFSESRSIFEKKCDFVNYINSDYGSGNVRLECAKHFVDICAWDNASCLDIQILDLKTEESIFTHVGVCESKNNYNNQLNIFLEWFQNEYH